MTTQTKITYLHSEALAKGWRKVRLGEIVENFDSKRVPLSSMQRAKMRGRYPYYGAAEIVDYINDYIYDGLYLLIAEDGTVTADGNKPMLQLVNGKFWVNNHAHILQGINDPETKYLFYALRNTPITPYITGAVQLKLTQENLNKIGIPYPENGKIREKITSILSAFDDKIELNNKISQTLEQMAQAIFKEWFVNFRFPGSERVKLVDSELGKIPEGWEVKSLDEIANFLNGLALQKYRPSNDRDALPVIKIREMNNGVNKNSELASSSIDEKYKVKAGDILFSWSGSLELMRWTERVGALNQHLFKVTSENYPNWFVFYWAQKHLSFFRVIASGKATSMGHIQRHHLSEAQVVVPLSVILVKADEIISPMFKNILELKLENHKLAALRDLLLPKLMSGEMRV